MNLITALFEAKKEIVKTPSGKFSIVQSSKFKKDLSLYLSSVKNRNNELKKLTEVLPYLADGMMPPAKKNKPHKLAPSNHFPGYNNIWDIHLGSISSNWLLLVDVDKKLKLITLLATGTHSYLKKTMGNGK